MRAQATRANPAQVEQHIHMQRVLGEDMPNHTEVTPGALICTLLLIVAFFVVLKVTGL